MSEFSGKQTGESISDKEALAFLSSKVDVWDFSDHTEQENARFVLHIAHWSTEVFGQLWREKGQYRLDPNFHYGEGFGHEKLPPALQAIVFTDNYGEIYPGNNNTVALYSAHHEVEEDPYIPKWDELSKIPVFEEMYQAAKADPEVMAMLIPGQYYITPGVEVQFQPAHFFDWGLQYQIWPDHITVLPYGKYGKTEAPFQYAAQQTNPTDLAKTALALVMLGNTYGRRMTEIDPITLDVLESRLEGRSGITIADIKANPNPRNSIKQLLLSRLLSDYED